MALEGQPIPPAVVEEVYRRSLANEKAKRDLGTAKGDTERDALSAHPRPAETSTVGDESQLVKRREVRVSLELHRAVAELLRSDRCEEILAIGRRNIARMRQNPRAPISEGCLDEWAEMLEGPIEILIERMLMVTERGVDPRQMTPFAGALTQRERLEAIRRARHTPK